MRLSQVSCYAKTRNLGSMLSLIMPLLEAADHRKQLGTLRVHGPAGNFMSAAQLPVPSHADSPG